MLGLLLVEYSYLDVLFDQFFALCSFDETFSQAVKKHPNTLGGRRKDLVSLVKELKSKPLGQEFFESLDLNFLQTLVENRNEIIHSQYGFRENKVFVFSRNSNFEPREITLQKLQRLAKDIEEVSFQLVGMQLLARNRRTAFADCLISFLKSNYLVCPIPAEWDRIWKLLMSKFSHSVSPPSEFLVSDHDTSGNQERREKLFQQIRFVEKNGGLGIFDKELRNLELKNWIVDKGL